MNTLSDSEKRIAEAKSIKESLDGKTYEVQIEANDEGVLYGSINPQQIIQLISDVQNNINVDSIALPQIKNIGEHSVIIHLYEDISSTITLSVIRK